MSLMLLSGFFCGAPFLETCISNNSLNLLHSTGAWKDVKVKQLQGEGGVRPILCAAVATSTAGKIESHKGRANIWRCPGGRNACPNKTFSSSCAEGYEGLGCSLCSPGFAWAHGHQCTRTHANMCAHMCRNTFAHLQASSVQRDMLSTRTE